MVTGPIFMPQIRSVIAETVIQIVDILVSKHNADLHGMQMSITMYFMQI